MGEKFTSRVGYLIRNFRIAAGMTQKELAEKCGLNESTIRNYELGNRYPDEAILLTIANNLNVSFFALSDPDISNIFSALHALFDIEWAYGLRPTIKDGEVCFRFGDKLPSAGNVPEENVEAFRKMVESWAKLRDKLEDGEITESEYWMKEIKYPPNSFADDVAEFSYNLDEDASTERIADTLKDMFPDFSNIKRKRKPKKD